MFRLGSHGSSNNTSFALFQSTRGLDDYFLNDATIFGDAESTVFVPTAAFSEMLQFRLLGSLTEANAMNLAIASGLKRHCHSMQAARGLHLTSKSLHVQCVSSFRRTRPALVT